MPRDLLFSEMSLIKSIHPPADLDVLVEQAVLQEHFSPPYYKPNESQWFNTDFVIELRLTLPPKDERTVTGIPIRQSTMGGDFFLVLDKGELPIRLELLSGEAFPKSAYVDELRMVVDAVRATPCNFWHQGIVSARFLRVVDTEDSIAFIASTSVDIPVMATLPAEEFSSRQATIFLRRAAEQQSMIEGVVYR